MKLAEMYACVSNSQMFKEWRKEDAASYLVHFFRMIQDKTSEIWDLGFYHPEQETMTSFRIQENNVILTDKNVEVMKEKGDKIEELNLEEVNMDQAEALEKAEQVQKEKYSHDVPERIILILQKKNTPRWNITYITRVVNILNMKIDAEKGTLIEESYGKLFSQKPQ